MAIEIIAMMPMMGLSDPGAASIAASAVKMTSVMTRGFISWMKSPTLGSAVKST